MRSLSVALRRINPPPLLLSASGFFALAIAVRAGLWLALGTPQPISGEDQQAFLAIRDVLLTTGRFLDPDTGLALAHRDFGYPLFLALLKGIGLGGLPSVWVVQGLLSAVTGLFLWFAVRRVAGERAAGFLGGLFLLQLSFASYGFLVYSETLACCLAAGMFLGLARWREHPAIVRQLVAGGFGAGAVLTRATTLLGVAGGVVAGVRGKTTGRRCWTAGAMALVVPLGLWSIRNYACVGVPLLNTTGIYQLYMGNSPGAPMAHSHRAANAAWDSLSCRPAHERAGVALAWAGKSLVDDPGRLVTRACARVLDALEGDRMLLGVARRGQFPERPRLVVLAVGALVILVSGIPCLLGLAAAIHPGPSWLASLGRWMFLGLVITQVLTIAHSRYSMPGWILLLPGAALMVERLQRGERAARRATTAAALLLLIVLARQVLVE